MGRDVFQEKHMSKDGQTSHDWTGVHVNTSNEGLGWEYYATFKSSKSGAKNIYKQKVHYIYVIKGIQPEEYSTKYGNAIGDIEDLQTPGTEEYLDIRLRYKQRAGTKVKNKAKWNKEAYGVHRDWDEVLWFEMQRFITGSDLPTRVLKQKWKLAEKGIRIDINKKMVKKYIKINITPALDKKIRSATAKFGGRATEKIRQAPIKPAKLFKVGTRKRGLNNKMWVVTTYNMKRGRKNIRIKRWMVHAK